MKVLIDTTVWSLALRRKPEDLSPTEVLIVNELTELIREGRSQLIGVIRQELLSGLKSGDQYERLRKTLRAFDDEVLSTEDFEAAAKASNECRARGVPASTVDILLCAVAMRRKWALLTTDPDFQRYAGVLPVHLHVPRA